MSIFINTGLSGLLASERALQTIANNVANAGTDGYVRQETNFVSNPIVFKGGLGVGTGVSADSIDRVYDQFLSAEVKSGTMAESRAEQFNTLAVRFDGLLGNPDLNISTSIQKFFDNLEAVNRDPTSTVIRQQLLAEADALESRFHQIDSQIANLSNEVDERLQIAVNSVNDIGVTLAKINERIAASGGGAPNDLLDQQDRLLLQLAEQIDFVQIRQTDGTSNILIGSGQPFVLGTKPYSLTLTQNNFDASKVELAYDNGSSIQPISSRIAGGAIAGMIGFRDETLANAARELGQIALGLTETFNTQHRLGSDLNGQAGTNFFRTLTPTAAASSRNSGSAAVSLSYSDISMVEAKDYELLYDGSNWQLTDSATGAPITMTGSGTGIDPYIADGMSFVVSAGAATGDQFMLRPTALAGGAFSVETNDVSKIAAAAMLATGTELQNIGSATISGARVSDPSAAGLLQPVEIIFDDPNTFRIYDLSSTDLSGPLAYTNAADITFNGWTVQVSGSPEATDRFSIAPTAAGSGDNANGLAMAGISSQGVFANGQVSIEAVGASMLTSIGSAAARSGQDLIAQRSLLGQAELDMESVSGVNLEEEAANLLRYQEAYMASSKIISIANDLFHTLLSAVGR